MKRLLTAAAILGLVALMLPAGVALAVDGVAPGTITLHKVVESGNADPSTFNIGLFREQPGPPPEVPPYHSGDVVPVDPGTYWLFEMPLDGGGYYEDSIRCTSPNHDPLSLVLDPGTLVSSDFGLNVPVAAGEVWDCTITNEHVAPPPITGWDVSTADCTVADGQGSITVTGFTGDDNQGVSVIKGFWVEPIEGVDLPQVLHITANGTYPLDPGTYNWSYGDRNGGGGPGNDFTIGPCPSPSESPSASPSASPSPSPTPTPVASPTPKPAVTPTPKPTSTTLAAVITLPQTGTIGASTGGSSSPLVPISIALLLVAATGLMLTRRPKSR